MRKKLFFLLTIFILLANPCLGSEVLTRDQFIQAAIKNNPRYQISAQEYLIALQANKSAKSLEDWNLIASGVLTESGGGAAGFSPTYQKVMSYTIGAEKYIASTGTAIKIEHGNSRIQSEYPPMTIPGVGTISLFPTTPYYISSLSLTVSQPLLRNAFGLATKNALQISDYSLDLAKIKLAEDWEDFIATLRNEYATWQKVQRNVELAQNKVKAAEEQLALVKRQKQYGLSEDLDLAQIKQKVQAYKIMLEQAKMTAENQSQKIIYLAGEENPKKITPQEFTANNIALNESAAIFYLHDKSNVKKTTDIMVNIQEKNLETKENQELMDLNLVLQAKPNAYADGFSDSLSQIGEYNGYTLTLNATRNLANDQAQAEAQKAREEYQKAKEQRKEILLNAQTGLSNLYTNLKYLDKMLDLNKNNLALAKERLFLERKKFNQGRSSVFFILQAEDDLLQAENALNETLFAREAIINQIKSFTDQYLVEYKDILKI